jgi:hypothetical protein
MPRTKNPFPVKQRYSLDLRTRVIYQRNELQLSPLDIARNLDIPLRTVERIIQLWKKWHVVLPYEKHGRSHKLEPYQVRVCYYFLLLLSNNLSDPGLFRVCLQLFSAHLISFLMNLHGSLRCYLAYKSIYQPFHVPSNHLVSIIGRYVVIYSYKILHSES